MVKTGKNIGRAEKTLKHQKQTKFSVKSIKGYTILALKQLSVKPTKY